jgi:hypothetical protein
MGNSPNMDPSSATWSRFFNASSQNNRKQIAQELDDDTDKSSTPHSENDTVEIAGLKDKDKKQDGTEEDVKISKQALKNWALKNIAVKDKNGESFKLLNSLGLTSSDNFQIYNESTNKAFQSVQGYIENNEIKAKVVAPQYYESEKDSLKAENTPFKESEITAIPQKVTEQAETQAAQPETAQTGTEAATGNQNPDETVQIGINGKNTAVTVSEIVDELTDQTIENIIGYLKDAEINFKEADGTTTTNIKIPEDGLLKALQVILDDAGKLKTFIAKFTTKEQVETLKTFLGDERFDELWAKIPEDEKTRINELYQSVNILVKSSLNGQLIAKKVNLAWIASKLANVEPAELEKLFKGEEALFPNNSGSGTYKVKIKPDHLKSALRLIAKDPAELLKLTSKLKTSTEVNALIKFIGKNTKEAQQLLIQLESKEIMRLLNASDDLDELAKILEIKNTNKLWAKLAGLHQDNLKTLLNKGTVGGELFRKLKFNDVDKAFSEIKNIGLAKPSWLQGKNTSIDFTNPDWAETIDLNKLKSADFKQLLLTLDDKQLKTFIQAKNADEVLDLLKRLKPEEIAEILSKPSFIRSLNSAKFMGRAESSLQTIIQSVSSNGDDLAKLLNKLDSKILKSLLLKNNLPADLKVDILTKIKGLKNSPLNQILSKLEDADLSTLLNLKTSASGDELFKVLGFTETTATEVATTIRAGISAKAANGILGQLNKLAEGAKSRSIITKLGEIIKPALPILKNVAKVAPFLAPLIDFIAGIALDKESYGKSAAGTIGSFAGGWAGGAVGAVAGTAVAAMATTAIAASSFGFLAPLAVPVGGILGITVTLLGAIAGSAGGGWLGDRLYEILGDLGLTPWESQAKA